MNTSRQLDLLERLREVVAENFEELRDGSLVEADEVYCPRCTGRRRAKVQEITMRSRDYGPRRRAVAPGFGFGEPHDETESTLDRNLRKLKEGMAPALFMLECVQCQASFTAVVYQGPDGEALAVFPSVGGGLTTKNTPKAVSFYLDQAARARAVDARSAAVAMYRVALEQLLEDQGYRVRMCGPKIAALETDIKSGKAPKWAMEADPEVMRAISQLGNGVLHTNGGDITLQENATPELLDVIALAVEELLDLVYERPAQVQARKAALQAAAAKMTK